MQKQLRLSKINIAGILLLVLLLVAVRILENRLFYDPFVLFFKQEGKVLPGYNGFRLFLGMAFRYLLNSVISLGIIWLVFKDKAILKLTLVLYIIFFILLVAALFMVLAVDAPSHLLLFYVRRFLIQPLFLILFLPAFYYQKYMR